MDVTASITPGGDGRYGVHHSLRNTIRKAKGGDGRYGVNHSGRGGALRRPSLPGHRMIYIRGDVYNSGGDGRYGVSHSGRGWALRRQAS